MNGNDKKNLHIFTPSDWIVVSLKQKFTPPYFYIGTRYLAKPLGWNFSYCSRLRFANFFWFKMNALGVGGNHTAFHFWETTEKTQTRVSKTDCMPLSGSYFVWENSPFYPEILGASMFRVKDAFLLQRLLIESIHAERVWNIATNWIEMICLL